jgi:hypothetical protein
MSEGGGVSIEPSKHEMLILTEEFCPTTSNNVPAHSLNNSQHNERIKDENEK